MLSSSGRNVCISSAVITKNKNKKLLEKKNGCQKSFLFSLFLFGFLLSCLLPPTSGQYQVYRQDPFAMLSATLQVITLLFTRLYAIYLPFCIIYMLLYPFYSYNSISFYRVSFFIDFLNRLIRELLVTGRQSTSIAHQELKLQYSLFNTVDHLSYHRR